ncbi:hypothetical protein FCF09_11540 [Enterococcus faecium]|nr:hypothetical protein FCF09_11540 [Enterococcus faecium]
MFLWLKTLYRKRAVTWPFIFYTIIWTLSQNFLLKLLVLVFIIILNFYLLLKSDKNSLEM